MREKDRALNQTRATLSEVESVYNSTAHHKLMDNRYNHSNISHECDIIIKMALLSPANVVRQPASQKCSNHSTWNKEGGCQRPGECQR